VIKTVPSPTYTVVLASTSIYRKELMGRLQIPFTTCAPEFDETPLPHEEPAELSMRLAIGKAKAVAALFPQAIIIGSDQVATRNNQIYGKPGTRDAAIKQLREMSGQEIIFHTAVCVLDAQSETYEIARVDTTVGFRDLNEADIAGYLEKEADALNCAGSAKSEGLGIALLRYIRGDDPTALIGLPLITVSQLLRNRGILLP
jgi:septum formation protein